MAGLGAAAVSAMSGAAKIFSDMGSGLADASARTGMAVESLNELKYAAEQTGADFSTLEGGVRKMQQTLSDAAGGTGEAAASLRQLGVSVSDLKGMSPDEQFRTLAKRISAISNPAARTAAAMDIFGKSGAALIPMMQDLDALTSRNRELGLGISTEDAQAADKLGDTIGDLSAQVKHFVFNVGASVAKVLQPWATKASEVAAKVLAWTQANEPLIGTIFKVAAGVVAAGAGIVALGAGLSGVSAVFSGLGAVAGVALKVFGLFAPIIGAILSPVGLLVAAVAGLGFVFSDTIVGVVGPLLDWFGGYAQSALSAIGEYFGGLKDTALAAFVGIKDALAGGDWALAGEILWTSLKLVWMKGIKPLLDLWSNFKAAFLSVANSAWHGLFKGWEVVRTSLQQTWNVTTTFLSNVWYEFINGIKQAWNVVSSWLQKGWNKLKGIFSSSFDSDAANKAIDEATEKERQRLKDELAAKQKANDDAGTKAILEEAARYDKAMEKLRKSQEATASGIDLGNAAEQAELQKSIDAMEKKRDELSKAAKAAASSASGPAAPGKPMPKFDPAAIRAGAGVAMQRSEEAKFGARGTFNAAALQGLQGQDAVTRKLEILIQETRETRRVIRALDLEPRLA